MNRSPPLSFWLVFIEALASPRVLFWLLPALIVLVVSGTLAQTYVGLYVAEQTIFASGVIWLAGYVPVPGGYSVMGLLGANLALHFLLKTRWTWRKAGVNLAHLGVLLLLFGGAFIAFTGESGFVTLAEGESGQVVTDYHQRDLIVLKEGSPVAAFAWKALMPGRVLHLSSLAPPLTLAVMNACWNGLVKEGRLTCAPLFKQDEANKSAVVVQVGSQAPFTLQEGGALPLNVGPFSLVLAKRQRPLPFTITLTDVRKDAYPGTDMARAYFSDVKIRQGEVEWPARIGMNAPLRLAGYTLYQSSYLEEGGREATVLAVTRHRGRWFPYAATALMALGILLHMLSLFYARKGGPA